VDKPLANSPNASEIQAWQVNIKSNLPAQQVFFSPFLDSSSPDPELFSD
jgi:hypothetical protein